MKQTVKRNEQKCGTVSERDVVSILEKQKRKLRSDFHYILVHADEDIRVALMSHLKLLHDVLRGRRAHRTVTKS